MKLEMGMEAIILWVKVGSTPFTLSPTNLTSSSRLTDTSDFFISSFHLWKNSPLSPMLKSMLYVLISPSAI